MTLRDLGVWTRRGPEADRMGAARAWAILIGYRDCGPIGRPLPTRWASTKVVDQITRSRRWPYGKLITDTQGQSIAGHRGG